MDQIEMLITMPASTVGRVPPFILPPIRPNMFLGLAPQGQNRGTDFERNHFQFGGTIPDPFPPPAINLPNVVPNVPPDYGMMTGAQPDVSLFFFLNYYSFFFLYIESRMSSRLGNK
jgi:hypothetical protein